MFIEISLLVIVALCAFEYFTKYTRIGNHVNKIPGPKQWPLLGSLPQLFTTSERISELLREWDLEYFPIYKIWTTHKAIIAILHPDDIEKLFTSVRHIEKSFFYYPLLAWLGTGLLTSHGAKWQQRRKMLTPAFHFNILRQYFESMSEHGDKTMSALKSKGEAVMNMTKFISNFTLDVICETAMGVKFTDKEFLQKYREGIHYVGDCTIHRIIKPWFGPESIFRLTPKGLKYKQSLDTLHGFTKKILKERKDYHEKTNNRFLNELNENESTNVPADDVYCGFRKKRLAMLDLLIAEEKEGRIDDQGIQEEVDTFTFEGHDTSAMALSYAVLLIAENTDAQTRIREEVSKALDRTGGKLEMSDVQRFTYLEMCLKESLRLYPIVPYISRNINEDLQLTNQLIPKGTMVQVHPYSVHRRPEFWPNPEKFDPDRFLPENTKGRHPYSYIPFSAGPRNCIGQKFAMMELKTFMSLLVYNFYLEPISKSKELIFKSDLVLRTDKPIRVKLVPIKKKPFGKRDKCGTCNSTLFTNFWVAHEAGVIVLHPDDLEKVLTSTKHTEKSFVYKIFHSWLGTGLLTSNGAKWHKRRKMLTPAFHFNVLRQYLKNIIDHAEEAMEDLKSKGDVLEVCDVGDFVAAFTLQVICETAMGLKFTDADSMNRYRKAVHCIGQSTVFRLFNPWYKPESIFLLTKIGQEYKRSLNDVHAFTAKMIKERKEFHEQTNDRLLKQFMTGESNGANDDEHIGYRKKRLAMLDLLIAAQKNGGQIDNEGIQEEVDTFTFEGHDTSGAALTTAVLLIAEHKDVQDRIRREVREVLDQSRGKLGISEIQRLTYLEMCVKECLRLYPSVQYISRSVTEDLQLTDYLVPKGSTIQINLYSVHRAPEFWPDPEKFDPERFSPENSKGRHPYSYIPFSAGPRNCIGQKFAMMELKVFMAYLIHNFYLEPIDRVQDLKFLADIVIRPTRPVHVKLVPIETYNTRL